MSVLAVIVKMMRKPTIQKLITNAVQAFKQVAGQLDTNGFVDEMFEKGIVICTVPDGEKRPIALFLIWKNSDYCKESVQLHLQELKSQGFDTIVSVLNKNL